MEKYLSPKSNVKDGFEVTDKTHRGNFWNKIVYSICCCLTFFSLGWIDDLIASALIELQVNTNVTFTQASSYFTIFTIAHMFGALGAGMLSGRISSYIPIILGLGVITVSTVSIPSLEDYVSMMGAFAGLGISTGVVETAVLAEITALWGSDTDVPIHAVCFAMALASMLSPISITPFLRNLENGFNDPNKPTSKYSLSSIGILDNNTVTFAKQFKTEFRETSGEGRLIFPFSISAGITGVSLVPFIVLYFLSLFKKFQIVYNHEEVTPTNQLSRKYMYVALLLIGSFSALDSGIDDAFIDFISYYCSIQMRWTSQNGVYVISVFNVSHTVGNLCGILYAKNDINPIKLAIVHSIISAVAFIGFIICGIYFIDAGVWISSILAGLGNSVLWPLMCAIAEEKFFPVCGKIASFIVIVSCLGSGTNSLVVSYFMDYFSNMCFGYILLAQSFIRIILIAGFVLFIWLREKYDMTRDSFASTKSGINNYSSILNAR